MISERQGRLLARVILVICAITNPIVSGCAAKRWGDDSWVGRDKLYHFTVSGVVGAGATLAASRNGASQDVAPVIGMTAVVGLGAGKEYYDENVKGSFWSVKDFVWDILGGAAGCYLIIRKERQ